MKIQHTSSLEPRTIATKASSLGLCGEGGVEFLFFNMRTMACERQLALNIVTPNWTNEPAHEIMVLFVLRKLIIQTRMRSHPVGLDVWFLVGPFVYFPTSCVRTAKALARLRIRAVSPEPSLVAYVISTICSWAGSNWTNFDGFREPFMLLHPHCLIMS